MRELQALIDKAHRIVRGRTYYEGWVMDHWDAIVALVSDHSSVSSPPPATEEPKCPLCHGTGRGVKYIDTNDIYPPDTEPSPPATSGAEMPDYQADYEQLRDAIDQYFPGEAQDGDMAEPCLYEDALKRIADRLREAEELAAERFDVLLELHAEAERRRQVYIQFEEEIANVTQQLAAERERSEQFAALVSEQCDTDVCEYDHHGLCQTHGLSARPCWQTRAAMALHSHPTAGGSDQCR